MNEQKKNQDYLVWISQNGKTIDDSFYYYILHFSSQSGAILSIDQSWQNANMNIFAKAPEEAIIQKKVLIKTKYEFLSPIFSENLFPSLSLYDMSQAVVPLIFSKNDDQEEQEGHQQKFRSELSIQKHKEKRLKIYWGDLYDEIFFKLVNFDPDLYMIVLPI
jgi:hypothetical protein